MNQDISLSLWVNEKIAKDILKFLVLNSKSAYRSATAEETNSRFKIQNSKFC